MNEDMELGSAWAQEGRQPRIAIIGAGMSGICAVIKLRKAGYTDLTVYEKAGKVGGTWRENTYPGLSCDVPSHWYSFSFEPNPNWSHRFSYGPEIQAYMEHVATKYDVMSVVNLNTCVTELTYEAPTWRLKTDAGADEVFDIVFSATGILHVPSTPDIPGLDSFAGSKFHTARWDHSVELEGKRIGIIGTGSTASQIVGAVAEKAGHLTVFQRTPQWMAPLPQKEYSKSWQRVLKTFPFVQRAASFYYFKLMEWTFAEATVGNKFMQKRVSEACMRNLEQNIPDPELRAKLTPDYQAACKRLIICSDFYPAMCRDNVELVTEGIDRIEDAGIRTADDALHELDVLVIATGFDVCAFILPTRVTGEDGLDLETFWDGAPRAHRAMSIPGFPNFWMIEGPTGPVGNLSLIFVTEAQLDYMIQCLDKMKDEKLAAIAPAREAYDEYNAAMVDAVQDTVWMTGGCQSWYFDKTGIPNLYPWAPRRWAKEMKHPDFSEYRLIEKVEQEVPMAV